MSFPPHILQCSKCLLVAVLLATLCAEVGKAQQPDPLLRFQVPIVKGSVRSSYFWEAKRTLFIGCILVDGLEGATFIWREGQPQPERLPNMTETSQFLLWRNDLYLAGDTGVYVWRADGVEPQRLLDKKSYGFISGGDFLIVRSDDAIYRFDGVNPPVQLAKDEKYFWDIEVWDNRIFYGNLGGLFVLDKNDLTGTPHLFGFADQPVDAVVPVGESLLINVRDDHAYLLSKGQTSAVKTDFRIDWVRGSLQFQDHTVVWADDGVYSYQDSSRSLRKIISAKSAGFSALIWKGDMWLGSNEGLLLWEHGKEAPVPVHRAQIGGISTMNVVNDRLFVQASDPTLSATKLWTFSDKDNPVVSSLDFDGIDEFIPWQGGVLLAIDSRRFGPESKGGTLYFLDPAKWQQGHIDIEKIPPYLPNQRIAIRWSLANVYSGDIPSAYRQTLRIVKPDGTVLQKRAIEEHDRKTNTDYELTIDPIDESGIYQVTVAATSIMDNTFESSVKLQIGTADQIGSFSLTEFLGWRRPRTLKDIGETVTMNLLLAGAIYFIGLLLMWFLYPWGFVMWHEWLAAERIPFSKWFGKFSLPLLVNSDRCLDATTARKIDRAMHIFNEHPDVVTRSVWAPAPLQIGDEKYLSYARPKDLPEDQHYIAGLFELRRALPGIRFTASIIGPGGLGKSAFAFQFARWASEGRLFPHRAIPIVLDDIKDGLDNSVRSQLRVIFEQPEISLNLATALMRKARVIPLIDGISEKEIDSSHIRFDGRRGASATLVITTRKPFHTTELVVIRPLALTLAYLDSVLDSYIANAIGLGTFSGDQRETIRNRLRGMMQTLQPAADGVAQIPMIVLTLLVQQAEVLVKKNGSDNLQALPTSFSGLIDGYLEFLLRDETDFVASAASARTAALIVLGDNFIPTARPQRAFVEAGLSKEELRRFASAGLLTVTGDAADPFFKFALDPVAEHLAIREYLIQLRDRKLSWDLLQEKIAAPSIAPPSAFADAFNQYAAQNGYQQFCLQIRDHQE